MNVNSYIPTNKATVRDLRNYIREATKVVNFRIYSYREAVESGGMNTEEVLEQRINYLKELGGVTPDKPYFGYKGGELPLGIKGKRKQELLKQAFELRSFLQMDIYTPQGSESYESKISNNYNKFKKTTGSTLSREEYIDLSNVLGAMGSKIVSIYGSSNITELYSQTDEKHRKNFGSILMDVYNSNKGSGLTAEQLLRKAYEALQ